VFKTTITPQQLYKNNNIATVLSLENHEFGREDARQSLVCKAIGAVKC